MSNPTRQVGETTGLTTAEWVAAARVEETRLLLEAQQHRITWLLRQLDE
ncbi:hypothetical protein [Roseomonas indoligenes]|uniref:Uncharacterized protein n=1 Tax=Roseomonas indoligenes TaxID=2820811 RepID=A0A940N3T8_9PROT|nr:hypothetical protein [Pararoseomonas indoligenes]MBP0496260.1 hypothetical protein [Pararoseomonas indoligenes]